MTALEIIRQGGNFSRYRSPLPPLVSDVSDLEEARAMARRAAHVLQTEFQASRVVLFGSLAEGDHFDRASDIDLAVWGIAPARFFAAVARLAQLNSSWKFDLWSGDETDDHASRVVIGRHGIEL